jgi:hypothetical protein
MDSGDAARIPVSALQEICGRAKVSDEAKALLTKESSTKEFIALLMEKELFKDALRMVAYLLPKREAVGWGCLCARHASVGPKGKPLPEVHAAVERWVSAPTDEHRWAARQAANKEKSKSPSGMLAMAAFFAGPSMTPPNAPTTPPPAHLTSELVAGAVVVAGVATEPEKAKEKYGVFMQKAMALIARLQNPQQG